MRLSLVLFAVLGLAGATFAQTNTTTKRTLSLQDSLQSALEHNFDVQIQRIDPRIAQYRLDGAYAGWDPTFNLSGQHNYSKSGGGVDPNTQLPLPSSESESDSFNSALRGLTPIGTTYNLFGNISENYGTISGFPTDTTRGQVGINLVQPLLRNFWIDNTRLNIAVSKNRLKFSEQGLRLRMMIVARDVEQTYYDLIAARENVKAQETGLELAGRLLAENKRRVEVGALAPLDEKQAEAEVAGRRADLISSRQTVSIQANALKFLMTDKYPELQGVELEPNEMLNANAQTFNIQESWARGMAKRPELLQAKLDLERLGIQLKYDKNQLFPQLDVFGTYGHGAGGAGIREYNQGLDQFRRGNQPFYSYGAEISLPLLNRAARSNYKTTKASMEEVVLTVKKLEQQILKEIDDAVVTAKASLERVESTRQARLYAEAALVAEQKKLENGKSTSFVVLQLQRDLTNARSAEIGALADYNKALSDLARSEGDTLDRRGVKLEIK